MTVFRVLAVALVFLIGARIARADDASVALAVSGLRAAVADPVACPNTRICPVALRWISASETLLQTGTLTPRRVWQALVTAAAGISLLERFQLGAGALEVPIQALVDAAVARVDEEKLRANERVAGLCSGVSAWGQRMPRLADVTLTTASTRVAERKWSLALRYLGTALIQFNSAATTATALQVRCKPPRCVLAGAPGFTPGDPANPSIQLIPADRGTLLDFDFSTADLFELPIDGKLRLSFLGLSYFRTQARFEDSPLGVPVSAVGAAAVTACTDSAGWVRLSGLTDSLVWSAPGVRPVRVLTSLRVSPPAVSMIATLFPMPPRALALRIGDEVLQADVSVRGAIVPGGASQGSCDFTHRVAAIEDVSVPAGTLSAARIESTATCASVVGGEPDDEQLEITTWVASRVGQVKAVIREAGLTLMEVELRCFELQPTSPGCGAF